MEVIGFRELPLKILRQIPHRHDTTAFKVAIVTGLSDPGQCRLSESQQDFMLGLQASHSKRAANLPCGFLSRNFPFVGVDESASGLATSQGSRQPVPILLASFANSVQYLRAPSAQYQRLARPHWTALIASTAHCLLVTGSCGLQLVGAALRHQGKISQIDILAFGPVASPRIIAETVAHPQISLTAVQGRQDWISRLFFRRQCKMISTLGHLGYWSHREVQEYAREWLCDKISAS